MLFYHIKTSGVDSNLFNENYKVKKRKKAKQMRAVSVCVCVCLCVCEKCVLIIHFKISLVLVSFVHLIFIEKHMVFYGQIVSLLLCRRVLNLFFFPSHSFLFLFILRNLKPKNPKPNQNLQRPKMYGVRRILMNFYMLKYQQILPSKCQFARNKCNHENRMLFDYVLRASSIVRQIPDAKCQMIKR